MITAEIDIVPVAEISASIPSEELASLVRYALGAGGAVGAWSIAVVLTTDAHVRDLHRQFMGIDQETDVMTFPHGEGIGSVERGGDIVISVERAAAQGPEHGQTTREEVEFLAVHGVLHLCGWNDETPEQRERMLLRQTEIIRAFSSAALLTDAKQRAAEDIGRGQA